MPKCPQRYYWQGTWKTLYPRCILHIPGVHGGLQLAAILELGPSGLKSNGLPNRLPRTGCDKRENRNIPRKWNEMTRISVINMNFFPHTILLMLHIKITVISETFLIAHRLIFHFVGFQWMTNKMTNTFLRIRFSWLNKRSGVWEIYVSFLILLASKAFWCLLGKTKKDVTLMFSSDILSIDKVGK